MKFLASIWLVVVLLTGTYLASEVQRGLPLETDILALLPVEEQNPVVRKANEIVTANLSRRVVVVISHSDRNAARQAAQSLIRDMDATGLVEPIADQFSWDRMKRLGTLYFPYRDRLLSLEDQAFLLAGNGEQVVEKALAQIFGVGTIADSNLLRSDPFLLLPSFILSLPFPRTSLTIDEGLLSQTDAKQAHIVVLSSLKASPYALDVQKQLLAAIDNSLALSSAASPGLDVKRLGAVFYAAAGSRQAIDEASLLSLLSFLGITLLVIVVFRQIRPIFQNLLVVLVGVAGGAAANLLLFRQIHIASLLFGVSLIGVSVDYGLYYTASIFDKDDGAPLERLKRVMPGISFGLLMTFIGYGALAVAPFPGLRQMAVFSAIGLLFSFATVVCWLPLIDNNRGPRHRQKLLNLVAGFSRLWVEPRWRGLRLGLGTCALVIMCIGAIRFDVDDDVHRLQALSPDLVKQQQQITSLIGANTATQFLLIEAPDDEAALQIEERISPTLSRLQEEGAFSGAHTVAGFIPSLERQTVNKELRRQLFSTWAERQREAIGLDETPLALETGTEDLTVAKALSSEAVPYLRDLVLAPGLHIVSFQDLKKPSAVREALLNVQGVTFADPVGSYSVLLKKYRERTTYIIILFCLIGFCLLLLRYGMKNMFPVFFIPICVVSMTVSILSALGNKFTFFHAIGMILVLVFSFDYAIFGTESKLIERSATLLAVWLAATTTLLSFGILSMSKVPAVYSFGSTMLIGIVLAFLISPLAVPKS